MEFFKCVIDTKRPEKLKCLYFVTRGEPALINVAHIQEKNPFHGKNVSYFSGITAVHVCSGESMMCQ